MHAPSSPTRTQSCARNTCLHAPNTPPHHSLRGTWQTPGSQLPRTHQCPSSPSGQSVPVGSGTAPATAGETAARWRRCCRSLGIRMAGISVVTVQPRGQQALHPARRRTILVVHSKCTLQIFNPLRGEAPQGLPGFMQGPFLHSTHLASCSMTSILEKCLDRYGFDTVAVFFPRIIEIKCDKDSAISQGASWPPRASEVRFPGCRSHRKPRGTTSGCRKSRARPSLPCKFTRC